MTKSILVMALAATLILSTFSLGSAFAVEEDDQFKIKTKKGLATCTIEDELCEGKAKAQFRLLTTNVEGESASGIAQGEIVLDWFNRTKGIACILPDIDEQRCGLKLGNNGPLSFVYVSNEVHMTGIMTDQNGNSYNFIATGDVGEFKNGKAAIDLSIEMIVIDATGAGFTIEIPVLDGQIYARNDTSRG